MTRTIACVVGARPNFVKIGPILQAFQRSCSDLQPVLIHTGQHYDSVMSDLFFRQLGLPQPVAHLEVGSGPHGDQTAKVLSRYESWLLTTKPRPAATLVVGDVNSTLACALASVKLGLPVVHVEAGLRSFDRTMPEEINRVVTDAVADLLLVTEPSGRDNLLREGRPEAAIRMVGNVMIDVLMAQLPAAKLLDQPRKMGLSGGDFVLWTMHRPSNVDDHQVLEGMTRAITHIAGMLPVIFPVHPRTRAQLQSNGLWSELQATRGVRLAQPLGYLEFLSLSSCARIIITDSGGLQEESTVLGIPCLTLRQTTERPVTVTHGTSTLVGTDTRLLERLAADVLEGRYKKGRAPELWDGKAGERIAKELLSYINGQ
jgi:UDP-N-acetylglucosamine 2-epimerase (non-hydrolysing)